MADLRKPSSISKRDLRRWMDGNKPIVRREAEFLDHDHDLITLAEGQDRGMLDDAVEWLVGTCLPFRLGHKVLVFPPVMNAANGLCPQIFGAKVITGL